MINLEIKFTVFEVLKFYLFFWKTKALCKRTKLKTFVSYVHIEVIERSEGLHIIVMIWIWQQFWMVDEAIYQHLCIWTLNDNWQSLESIVDASVICWSLFSIYYIYLETSKFHSNRASSLPHSLLSQFIIICLPLASGK